MGVQKYGVTEAEKEIVDLIVHNRKSLPGRGKKTFKEIASDLNSRCLFPRTAQKWTPMLVFHAYKTAVKNG